LALFSCTVKQRWSTREWTPAITTSGFKSDFWMAKKLIGSS
jgi:hypothetical protein